MTRGPVFEQNYKLHFLPAVASLAAPTAAEITAGDYLGRLITKDGAALGISQNRVDIPSIDSLFDPQRMGSWGASPSLTFYRDDTDETDGWDLVENGTKGFLLISPFGAPIATSVVYIFPVEMGVPMPADSAANAPQTFTVEFAVTSEPNMNAVVAA